MGGRSSAYRVLVGKLGRPRYKWEDNTNLNFQEMGWGGMD